jgi:hypothetical protein
MSKASAAAPHDEPWKPTLRMRFVEVAPWAGVALCVGWLILDGMPPLVSACMFALLALAGAKTALSTLHWRHAAFDAMRLADQCFEVTDCEPRGAPNPE